MKCKYEGEADAWGEIPCYYAGLHDGLLLRVDGEDCIGTEKCILFEAVK